MTTEEFSNAFDTLLSSHTINATFGEGFSKGEVVLDEYEKSLFLTKAQEYLVISLYNGKNSSGDSFESTEELRRYLANIVAEATLSPDTTSDMKPIGIESRSRFFTLPTDLWFITYESVSTEGTGCSKKDNMRVYPVRQDEYQIIKDNPFRGVNSRRALRLDLADGVVEIISNLNVSKYYIRYIKKLTPIILTDLPEGLTIGNDTINTIEGNKETNCMLHEALHQKILELAVRMALQSRGYTAQKTQQT